MPAVEWIVSRPLEVATLTTLRGDIDAVQALEIAFSQGALGGYVLGFDILPNSADGNETIRFQADRFGDAMGLNNLFTKAARQRTPLRWWRLIKAQIPESLGCLRPMSK